MPLIRSSSIRQAPRPIANSPVIIYLPSGPGAAEPSAYSPLPALALSSNATVVCIHYRLSAAGQSYPTPIHDVLAGYDWVLENLAHNRVMVDHAKQITENVSIGVCGQWIGGGLSTMLALTECRATNGGVKAAAVGNAMVDWTSLLSASDSGIPAETTDDQKRAFSNARRIGPSQFPARSGPSASNDAMLLLRSTLFRRPDKYFDPFASPLLFFRTPASELPNDIKDRQACNGLVANNSFTEEEVSSVPVKKRRSHRRYPPSGSGLRLPYMRFEVGVENEFREQGEAMVDVLRKSVNHWEEESYGALDKETLSRRIQLVERDGQGMWGEREIRELGGWFANYLRG